MNVYLRDVTIEDVEIIFEWRNDLTARCNSFSNSIIDIESHIEWFNRKLAEPDCYMYILMDGEECVGQIRVDKVGDVGEISYIIAPDKRKMGYGKKILKLIEESADENIKVLTGFVKIDNQPSRRCFTYNNYSEFIAIDNIVCYIKAL